MHATSLLDALRFCDATSQLHVLLQVVSPAVQPRALWVVAHHWQAGASLDAGWMHLLRALAAALSGNEDALAARRHAPADRVPATCTLAPVGQQNSQAADARTKW